MKIETRKTKTTFAELLEKAEDNLVDSIDNDMPDWEFEAPKSYWESDKFYQALVDMFGRFGYEFEVKEKNEFQVDGTPWVYIYAFIYKPAD